jgi:hypothetical protein
MIKIFIEMTCVAALCTLGPALLMLVIHIRRRLKQRRLERGYAKLRALCIRLRVACPSFEFYKSVADKI